MQQKGRLTAQAKTILAAWSSFDDPITVILAIYLPVFLGSIFPTQNKMFTAMHAYGGLFGYLTALGINILYAFVIYLFWLFLKRSTKHPNYFVLLSIIIISYLFMLTTFSFAIYFFWMLGIALVGLFMRPKIEKFITLAVHWALSMAAVLLGVLLIHGINVVVGILIDISAFAAQMFVGYILCKKLPQKDKIHIALAQQNGITSIILALLFEPYYAGTVAIVAPAILTINILHGISNMIIDANGVKKLSLTDLLPKHEKLKSHLE